MEEKKDALQISFLAFEASQSRMERINRRMFILILALIIALVAETSFIVWEHSHVESPAVVTQEADSSGYGDIQMQNIGGDFYEGKNDY